MRSPEYHRLRMAGIDRSRTMSARYPNAAWLRFDGGLTWDADDDANAISEVHGYERRIGYDSRLLAADKIASTTPGVDPGAVPPQGAIFNPGEGWVDLPSLIDVLLAEYTALDGKFVSGAGRASIVVRDGRVAGVDTQGGGSFATDAALLAAGPSIPAILAEAGIHIPDMT